jgi:predicted homoserine dehydrogenase-like protein
MTAVANATGLTPALHGLEFPPCGVDDLATVLRPQSAGGVLHHAGQVEVISSLQRDGTPVFRDLRWGVYVTFAADSDYVRRCFKEYGLVTDDSGEYSSMYKPFHLIGLELGISVASVALRAEATGAATDWRGDCVAAAKRDLQAGETLDGEGGFTVYGKLLAAEDSLKHGALPIGLAHRVRLKQGVAAGAVVRWEDVEIDAAAPAVKFRREMEAQWKAQWGAQREAQFRGSHK